MPNRVLRDWTDSFRMDGISAEAERLFVRLIMKADDYGRFHAHPKLVKSACFPLSEDLRAHTVETWLTELSASQLVCCYTSETGRYMVIPNYGQRMKQSRAKFPPPPGKPPDWVPDSRNLPEVPGSSRKFPSESETETETEKTQERAREAPDRGSGPEGPPLRGGIPTLAAVKAFAPQAGVDPEVAETWWHECEGRGWADARGQPIVRWQHALTAYGRKWQSNGNRPFSGGPPKPKKQFSKKYLT